MWQQAGIKVTVHPYTLAGQIQAFLEELAGDGSDRRVPTTRRQASAVGFRFLLASSPFSGVHDPHLDRC